MARDLARAQQILAGKKNAVPQLAATPQKPPGLDITKKTVLPAPRKPPVAQKDPSLLSSSLPLEATQPPSFPSQAPIGAPVHPPATSPDQTNLLKLSDILAEARKRATTLPPPKKVPTAQKIEDLLPIEERREVPPKIIDPPHNLPIEEALPLEPKLIEKLVPMIPRPSEQMGPPTPQKKQALLTPEEILGLSPHAPQVEKPTPSPAPPQPPVKEQLPIPKPPAVTRPLSSLKFTLIAGVLGIISITVIGGIVWKLFIQEPPLPPPLQQTGPVAQPLPAPLIVYPPSQIEEIEIPNLTYDSLKPKLDILQTNEFLPNTLAYIPIKIKREEAIQYLTLSELFETLQIDAPPALLHYKEYTLFLYTQKITSKTICEKALIQSFLCYGPRLGLVMKLPEDTRSYDIALKAMEEWEKTLAQDFQPLMIFVPQTTQQKSFEMGKHVELETHYMNLPIHTMSVDWILTNKYLVISTSKDAARAAVDNLESP